MFLEASGGIVSGGVDISIVTEGQGDSLPKDFEEEIEPLRERGRIKSSAKEMSFPC